MTFDFAAIPEKEMPAFKGGDGSVFVKAVDVDNNRILQVRIPSGSSIGMHTHETNSETYMVVSGTAEVQMDGAVETVTCGQVHHCPKGHGHLTANKGGEDLILFAMIPEHP